MSDERWVWGVGLATTAADGTAIWTPSRIFTAGEKVVHEGKKYVAQWWTRNQVPGTPYGPWLEVGVC